MPRALNIIFFFFFSFSVLEQWEWIQRDWVCVGAQICVDTLDFYIVTNLEYTHEYMQKYLYCEL